MKFIFALLTLAMLAACGSATPTPPGGVASPLGQKTCVDIAGTDSGKVCHWKSACPVVKGTLWYQHGLLEDENAPDAAGTLLVPAHDEFKAMAVDNCLDIVAMSWGTSWMIRPPNTLAEPPPSPSWKEVQQIALPFIEKQFALVRPYTGYGQSMGGFNTATIANLAPQFFDRVILTHPVITDFPDFSSNFKLATVLIGLNFTPQEWVIANPIETITSVVSMKSTYVEICHEDEYGLFDGPSEYVKRAKARGFNVTLHIEGPGCGHTSSPEQPSLANWMAAN